jgi:DNA repair protein RecN (Recombination protein N)
MWRFQLEEISRANLKPDEEEALTAKRNRLGGLDKLNKNAAGSLALLYGGNNIQLCAADQVSRTVGLIAEISRMDPAKEQLYSNILEVSQLLQDIVAELRDYVDELDVDPNELEKIEARLDLIYRLRKKYGGDVEHVLKKKQELQQNLDNLENIEVEIAQLNRKRRKIVSEITTVCNNMNALRTSAATKISQNISTVLEDLGMKDARFFIRITRKTSFGPNGNDIAEFMISPNPGEPEKPLKRIASGGEMSRIMLAIKTILADRINTVIFDEVDTGVSGRTAQQVAEKLMGISRCRQILCITHLPQIAAMADTHFLIEKSVEGERTVTRVFPLENSALTGELARLIGGAQITDATMAAAQEMKPQANELK